MSSVLNLARGRSFIGVVGVLGFVFASAASADTYYGNGGGGFGGPVGSGSLTISEDVNSNITFTLNTATSIGSASGSNNFILYIDSVAGGYSSNATFTDNGDGGREATSGTNDSNPSHVNITFPTGFGADYAISFEYGYVGLFQLSNPANFNPIAGNGATANDPYTLTIPASDLGLSYGQVLSFDGDLISQTAYGSNETIGASTTTPDSSGSAPNAGFNGAITFTSDDTFTAVPEPTSLGLLGTAVFGALGFRRKSRASVA